MTQNPIQPLDILVIATHPDDAEIGVGGTLARCGRAGLRDRNPRPDERRADASWFARTAGPRDRGRQRRRSA